MCLQDKDSDENWHLFKTALTTGMTTDLTPIDGIQARIVSYIPGFPDIILVGLNSRDERFHDVYRLITPDGGTEIRYRKDEKEPFTTLLSWGPDEAFGGITGFDQENCRIRVVSSVDANASRFLELDPETMNVKVLGQDPIYDVGDIMVNPVNQDDCMSRWKF